MKHRVVAFVFGALVLALFACIPDDPDGAMVTDPSQSVISGDDSSIIPDRYIVVFKNRPADVRRAAESLVDEHGGELRYTYDHVLHGFAAKLSPEAVAALSKNPMIARVTPEHYAHLASTEWGLDRVDQRSLPLDNQFYHRYRHGTGVNVYVLDTGIRPTHSEFQSANGTRVVKMKEFMLTDSDLYCLDPSALLGGHGTHIAALIGGRTYGVADSVSLYSVRVLDCTANPQGKSAEESTIIAGLEWVADSVSFPAVVNLSMDVDAFESEIDTAIQNLIVQGITVVVAAGNDKGEARNYSPAKLDSAIVVGASTASDQMFTLSNDGDTVDLFAPGENIVSAGHRSDTDTLVFSGTSQAAGFVSGAAALYLQDNPNASPLTVQNALVAAATSNALSGFRHASTPNKLLYTRRVTPLSVYISGPTSVSIKASVTFTAIEDGAMSPTRTWQSCFADDLSSCTWTGPVLGTATTLSRTIGPDCTAGRTKYHLKLVTHDTDLTTDTAYHTVNLCGGPLSPSE